MPRRRSLRFHQRPDSDDEFETPALQAAAERNNHSDNRHNAPVGDDSDDDLQSESGLGESPEEDLIEDEGQSSDDDKNDDVDSDSDSAPEEVSFAKSREAEERRQETIRGEIHKGRVEEKEKRRKRDELFKLQKKGKLAVLNKRKLPEELLEELSQQQKKQKIDQDKKKRKVPDQDKKDTDEDKESHSEEEEEDVASDSGEDGEGWDKPESLDFLPLGDVQDERLDVVSLKGRKGHGSVVTQSVADFKQAMLFGGRHKRVTSQQARMQQAKRLARR